MGGDAASGHEDGFAADNLPPVAQWPELIVTRPEFEYPPRLNCVGTLLDRWIENRDGDRLCLISLTETLSCPNEWAACRQCAPGSCWRPGRPRGSDCCWRCLEQ